jgi:hypothetical protein
VRDVGHHFQVMIVIMIMNFYKRMFDSNLNRAGTPEILNLTLEAAHPVKRGSVGF